MSISSPQPTQYYRVMVTAMKHQEPFSVMAILREVNADGHHPLNVQQCLQNLKRMRKHGLITSGALGRFEWKE
jgi:DNA-binding PadR family transcriptional regulator